MCTEIEKWQSVRVRFFGNGLHVETVEPIIGLKPTVAARAGEVIGGSFLQRTNEWIWEHPAEDLSFSDRVLRTLDVLESKKDAIAEILSAEDVSGELTIECTPGHDDGVSSLFPKALDRIMSLGLVLSLDLYRIVEQDE
jgi:hypothetical protein